MIPRLPTGDCIATGPTRGTGMIESGQSGTCIFENFCCATGTTASQAKT